MKEIFFDQDDIERIKGAVASGNDDLVDAYTEMVKNADEALDQEALTVTRKGPGRHEYWTDSPYGGWKKVDGGPDTRDGQINPQADRGDYYAAIALDNAVRNLGLGYVFEGDEKYAEKAVSLIRTWCLGQETNMTPELTNCQSPIELFITIPGMFLGGGLCEDSSAWEDGEWDAWLKWVRDFTVSVTERPFTNNFANWKNVLVSISAIVQDDADLLDQGYQDWRDLIPDQVGADGHLTREIGRTKSLNYSTYGLNAMIQVAWIAERRSVDLFGYTTEDARGIEAVLDYHAPYVVDHESWPYEQISPYTGDNIALYELAYAWKQKESYRSAIEKWGRPMFEHRIAGPVTLTHGVALR